MTKATQSSVLNYIKTGHCPYCGKLTDSPAEDQSFMEDSFYADRTCGHCFKNWADIFRFVGILPAIEGDAIFCSDLHGSVNADELTIDLIFKCPKCGSRELNNDSGERDWEGEEGYWEELTCACGAVIIATYTAKLSSLAVKQEPASSCLISNGTSG